MDRLVETACDMFGTSMGLVSLLGDDALRFRSVIGIRDASVPQDTSVTRTMVHMGEGASLVIKDTLADDRVRNHPLVVGETAVRFFAGATVSTREGLPVGLICVMDNRPRRSLTARQQRGLLRLARMAGDVLDRSASERRQREQLGKLKLAEAVAGVGHWRLDVLSDELEWSDEAYRIHGVLSHDFVPTRERVLDLYDPADRPIIAEVFKGRIPPGDSYLARVQQPDGSSTKTRASATLEWDEDGRMSAIFGVVRDITAREAERAALQRSEANYRLLADNLGDVIARISPSGKVEYASPAAVTVMGYEPGDLIDQPARRFIHPEDWRAVRNSIAGGLAGTRTQRIRHRVLHRAGHAVWVESHCRSLSGDRARPYIVLTLSDVTERKHLEEEWIAARDRAEAADRAKSEFLANMSHELRTPLTSVIGFSGLLQTASLSPQQSRQVDMIAMASRALLGVINDILDYSKLEASAVSLEERPFDPVAMVQNAASLVSSQCRERGLRLEIDIASDLPELVFGDESRLRQVVLNFLSNAVKFTAQGSIRIEATWTADVLRVAVIDTGIGVAPDQVECLFDRFQQADASTTRLYGGTGLGLSISRKLIDLMGGSLGVISEVARGSTFWFEVPLNTAEQPAEERTAEQWTPIENLRVLVADDVAANRELVTAILESFGVAVHTVEDGTEAVEAVQSGSFDIVLMDVHMPRLDGLSATRAIRRLPGLTASIPIVALTANVQPDQVERCRQAGMDAHVGKPIQIAELLQAIATVATGSRRAENLFSTGTRPKP